MIELNIQAIWIKDIFINTIDIMEDVIEIKINICNFLEVFIFTNANINLNMVIEIQNIVLYWVAYYLFAILLSTAYEDIQPPNPV